MRRVRLSLTPLLSSLRHDCTDSDDSSDDPAFDSPFKHLLDERVRAAQAAASPATVGDGAARDNNTGVPMQQFVLPEPEPEPEPKLGSMRKLKLHAAAENESLAAVVPPPAATVTVEGAATAVAATLTDATNVEHLAALHQMFNFEMLAAAAAERRRSRRAERLARSEVLLPTS